jgi:hypothetical protein
VALIIGGGLTAFLVLCCAGTLAIGAITGPQKPKASPTAAIEPVAPAAPSPSASPSLTATAVAPTSATTVPVPAPPVATTTNPAPPPPPPPTEVPTHSGTIRGGAFCKVAEEGWVGFDASGRKYVCRDVDNDGHPHWVLP